MRRDEFETQTICLCLVMLLLAACGAEPTTAPTQVLREPVDSPASRSATTIPPTEMPDSPTQTAGAATSHPALHPGWTSYSSANWVEDLAFDDDGMLWAVGIGGAVRWNVESGEYTKFTVDDGLASNLVWAVAVGPDASVWFGTIDFFSEVSRYDGETWRTYDGLGDSWGVRTITAAPDGALWFDSEQGVSRLSGETWTTYTTADGLADDRVQDIAVAPDGAVWFATGEGVSRFDPLAESDALTGGEAWTAYTTAHGLPDGYVLGIAAGPDGTVWCCTKAGLSRFDPHTGSEAWFAYAEDDGLPSDCAGDIAVSDDGTVWFSAPEGGVVRFDGETWSTFTTAEGLAHNAVGAIAVGPNGTVWFGTTGGVSSFDGEAWRTYRVEGGLPDDYVSAIAVARDGALWIGTPDAVSRFDGQAWVTYTTEDGLAGGYVESIAAAPNGELWIGTRGAGVSRFDGRTWRTYTEEDGLASDSVRAIAAAPDGAVWFGTKNGVSRFDPEAEGHVLTRSETVAGGEAWTTYTTEDGLAGDWVASVAVAPDGALWFGTVATFSGVSRFDPGAGGEAWTTYTTDNGLAVDDVWAIAVDPDGAVWFGGDASRVSRYNPVTEGETHAVQEAWTTFTTEDGLVACGVRDIEVAADGALWFACDLGRGVRRYDPYAETDDLTEGQAWTAYTTADGLATNWVQDIAVGADGTLWFATWGGVSRYEPAE